VLVGASHHTAPVAVRERLAGAHGKDWPEPLLRYLEQECGPAVVLATCNRLEVYCWTARPVTTAASRIKRALASQSGLGLHRLRPHLYVRTEVDAVHHLIRVAAGLDSLALGESQIIGQVREAWLQAAAMTALGPELNTIFRQAIDAARRVRNLGSLHHHPSVASIAVAAAAQAAGGLNGREVTVLGAGVTGKMAARALAAAGAGQVTLLNRTLERADSVVEELALGGRVLASTLAELPHALSTSAAVICATAAAAPVLTAEMAAAAVAARAGRPLVIVDIAVPRDVEPEVRQLPGVTLIDLDDLEQLCPLDAGTRHRLLEQVERAAREAAESCIASLRARDAIPDIVALRRRAAAIRDAELRRFAGRLSGLAPRERAAVEQLTHAIVQKLLHPPTVALRRATATADGGRRRAAILDALDVEPE
jgi:glutamyl-tRNA reductase